MYAITACALLFVHRVLKNNQKNRKIPQNEVSSCFIVIPNYIVFFILVLGKLLYEHDHLHQTTPFFLRLLSASTERFHALLSPFSALILLTAQPTAS